MHRYIAIEGPIGVGKTSLAKLLAVELDTQTILESSEENPFLSVFYADRKRMAFQTQIFFLLSRYNQQQELFQQDLFNKTTIIDYIFARDRIFAYLNLDNNELALYEQIYSLLHERIPKPDLVIYLSASTDTLLERLESRGRDFEKNISMEYLEEINQSFNRFFFHYSDTPLLVINTSAIDFVKNPVDLKDLVKQIRYMKKGTQYYVPMSSKK
ncbi:MAG: deoxynucleoside kinase [Nitrospirae bacterium]|nr:deoxynucleoside kinase [Nitrospirota bacterium]